ncbi:MAG: oligosaccharide flippase family protein [Patescibacteria group bacterium]
MKQLIAHALKFTHSQGVRQSGIMIVGNAAATGFAAIALMIISRSLGPEQFGVFSVGFAIVLMLSRINDVGLSFAVQKFASRSDDRGEKNNIYSYSFQLRLIAALFLMVIGVLITPTLAAWLNFPQQHIITIAFFLSGCTVIYEQLQAMLHSLQRFSQSVLTNAIQAIIKLLSAIAISLTAPQAILPFFISYIIAPIIPLLFFRKLFPAWVKVDLFKTYWEEQKLLKGMAFHSGVGLLALGIIENIDVLLVQGYLDSYETGLLSGASRIALMFSLLAYSLGSVLQPRVARYTDRRHLKSYLKKASLLAAASLLGFTLLAPLSHWFILFTIGPEYLESAHILTILLAASFLTIAVMPFIAVFFSANMPWYFSVSGILQVIILVGGNILFLPEFGLEAAAWSRLVTRVFLLFFTVGLVWVFWQRTYGIWAKTSQST